MAARPSTVFVCQHCGHSHPRWQGQCDNCGQWNTLVEELQEKSQPQSGGGRGGRSSRSPSMSAQLAKKIVTLPDIEATKGSKRRLSTAMAELDRVLGPSTDADDADQTGQGMVAGAVMLVGGEPGIGKSTLLTQLAVELALRSAADRRQADKSSVDDSKMAADDGPDGARDDSGDAISRSRPILYVAGEESPSQIALRINRFLRKEHAKDIQKKRRSAKKTSSLPAQLTDQLQFITTTDVDEITTLLEEKKPRLAIIDSVQSLTTQDLTGAAGSVGQLREATERLTTVAKKQNVPIFLVGHVTKEGAIAGPKVLEHIVDAVLELSGERTGDLRILRALKNRFGATDEVGLFRVVDYGLEEVDDPTAFFLEHADQAVAGSATVCVMEGTRPLLVEVQALVVPSQLAMPRRVGRGVSLNRVQVLAAVLEKHAKLPLGSHDIFVSVAGGFSINEPAVDLGMAVAIWSSLKSKPVPEKTVYIGEIGLLGEVRGVSYLERRVKEARRLGYRTVISRQSHRHISRVLKEH